jgi:hypothetical protein
MHAIGYLSADLNNEPDRLEIYFEEQAVAELGFSYEDAVGELSGNYTLDCFTEYPFEDEYRTNRTNDPGISLR